MNDTETEPTGRATYSPEDNKLRLYIGRVPREEYLKLRAEGWVTLHKQREAGGGDFAATWTPERRDTALDYAAVIEDEDMGPEERSADRAERFGMYRDKRTVEATGHADTYDAGPSVHGYQNQARAERAAARHDRKAALSCDAWNKAEYWQSRTAGVIAHALHKSLPGVRMGRIKTLEAELRKYQASIQERKNIWADFQKLAGIADPTKQTELVRHYTGSRSLWSEYLHPRADTLPDGEFCKTNKRSLYSLVSDDHFPITGAEAVALFFSDHNEPGTETDWTRHLTLRIAYENQMLEAQGGRLEQCEVMPGGKLGGKLILKVSKSSVTKRATSVKVLGPKVGSGWHYQVSNIPFTEWAEYHFDLERIAPGAYTPPTPESLAELETVKVAIKGAKPEVEKIPLVNPTDADADRLQALWNERAKAKHCAEHLKTYSKDYAEEFLPATVCKITQAVYSQNSNGSYSRAETRGLRADGFRARRESNCYSSGGRDWDKQTGKDVCILRITREANGKQYTPPRVIVLTDKPQKPFPPAVWEKYTAPETDYDKREKALLRGQSNGLSYTVNA